MARYNHQMIVVLGAGSHFLLMAEGTMVRVRPDYARIRDA